jgi:hypothetical protein
MAGNVRIDDEVINTEDFIRTLKLTGSSRDWSNSWCATS